MTAKERNWSVKKHLESYGSIWVGYDQDESSQPCPMTLKQANFIASAIGGFVVVLT